MRPVRVVLASLGDANPGMERVSSLMREGYAFTYTYSNPYRAASPRQTAARGEGDCKAKALWLCKQMNDDDVRFVIGKDVRFSRRNHAWLLWRHEGRWWVLDPTLQECPIPADEVGKNAYIPLFSWSATGTYQHRKAAASTREVARAKAHE